MSKSLLAGLTAFDQIESDHVEPGLLPAFRLFVGFEIVALSIGIAIAAFIQPERDLHLFGQWSLLWMLTLLVYLSWPMLRRRLGKSYLPIALFVASAAPIMQRILFFYAQGQTTFPFTATEIASSGWRLLILLLAPLVFIAWQYHFHAVLYFCIGTFLLNVTLASLLIDRSSPEWIEVVDLSFSSAIALALIGYIITRLIDAQRERQRMLAEANAKLVDHVVTVEQLAVSQERNRLARDLHDTLAHTLSAVSVQLEAVDSAWDHTPEQAHLLLGKALSNARSGLAETRRALRALRASPLDDLGLVLALRHLAESTATRNGMNLELDLPSTLSLPSELEQNIYRIAQESLTNVVRHANAHTFVVRLTRDKDLITLTIADDGQGFTESDDLPLDHYGLQGMKERAQLMGAKLDVHSVPGRGSRVQLLVQMGVNTTTEIGPFFVG